MGNSCPYDYYPNDTISNFFNNWKGNAELLNICANNKNLVNFNGRIFSPRGVPENFSGSQIPQHGNGYAGIGFIRSHGGVPSLSRFYLETKLESVLIPRLKYFGSFYVSAPETEISSCSGRLAAIGLFVGKEPFVLSDTGIYFKDPGTTFAKFSPPQIENDLDKPLTDTVNWMEIKGSFEAKGNEEFLSLGCFNYRNKTIIYKPNACVWNTTDFSYYYVDNVSLIPQNTFHHYDSSLCYPTILSAASGSNGFVWFDGDTIHETRTFNDTGVYWVKSYFYDRTVYMVDTFSLKLSPYLSSNMLQDIYRICENESVEIVSKPKVNCNFLWSNGSTQSTSNYLWNTNGKQWVTMFTGDCRRTDSFEINYIKEPTLLVTKDTSVCVGNTVRLQASAQVPVNYFWSTGDTTSLVFLPDTGFWYLRIQDKQNNCANTDTIHVRAKPPIAVIASSDTVVCFDEVNSILLWAGTYQSYLWEPSGETSPNFRAYRSEIYKLTVVDSNNCKGEKYIEVLEKCKTKLQIPNAFTPNGDGINDEYLIPLNTRNLESFEIQIYNRWGVEVFSSTNYSESWTGKNCSTDSYTYKLKLKFKNRPLEYYSGIIDLIR
ncbi:MAG: gliding motility-associated C-terminal domain-containing protein [Bacteroidia bacterium]